MELIMGKVQTQQSQKGGSFNEHGSRCVLIPRGMTSTSATPAGLVGLPW